MPNFGEMAKKMSPKGWVMLGGSLVLGVAFLMIVMSVASKPSYSTLEAGIDPAQTGKITSTLSAQGISYQLQNNGTAIAVNASQTAAGARRAGHRGPAHQPSSPASPCSTRSSSARATSSSRSPTSAPWRASSPRRSRRSTASPPPPSTWSSPTRQDQLFSDQTQPATASVLLGGQPALRQLGARHRPAGRLQRPQPVDQQGHGHRRLTARCCGRPPTATAPAPPRSSRPTRSTTRR